MIKARKRTPPAKKRAGERDDVGYGKPPREHQFKPGKSGNPKGRPKGAKNPETILLELLQQQVGLNERGKARRITILEAIFRRIIEDGLKGNTKSAAFILNRYQAATSGGTMESGLSEDDEAVLEAYLQKYRSNNEG
ncbi:DUF5681 domain-containing protein [Bradyrhizobium sp. JYMT SZCCT0428]|uniref:DUF5681 domain-containing protein n=1 Tax=Bradyrhizobium sp. JYMT SZCCT0428 TaxID=2807673 RepID=UPI001BA7C97A|nr:DUF5681 domain-containing protein [Bradyrhizobium sp. JYMT SZCCT0428]MBR1153973.1 hypothetical protein [Bradyrhizobium sp. JYMT SZCCT0428]